MGSFKKAVKESAKLRMALMGAPGSGKSYTALSVAKYLAGPNGAVAAIDTEHGSLSKYSDLFEFDVCELTSFHPDNYTNAVIEAGADNYSVLIVDSLSHAWSGKDGLLEEVDKITKRKQTSNSFQSWKDANPILNRLIDSLLSSPCHIIVTMRTKVEWVIEQNERGKSVPRKIGTAPIMKDQISYEFDVVGEMTDENEFVVSKSRCSALAGQVISKPGRQLADTLSIWLGSGAKPSVEGVTASPVNKPVSPAAEGLNPEKQAWLKSEVIKLPFFTPSDWLALIGDRYQVSSAKELTEQQFGQLRGDLKSGVNWFANMTILPEQVKTIQTKIRSVPGYTDEKWAEMKSAELGVESVKDLTRSQAAEFLVRLQEGNVNFPQESDFPVDGELIDGVGPEAESESEMEVEVSPISVLENPPDSEGSGMNWADLQEVALTAATLDDLEEWKDIAQSAFQEWIATGEVKSTAPISQFFDRRITELIRQDVVEATGVEVDGATIYPIVDYVKSARAAKSQDDLDAAMKRLRQPRRFNAIKKAVPDIEIWLEKVSSEYSTAVAEISS